MATNIEVNSKSIRVKFREQINGVKVNLVYYPGIRLENPETEWEGGKVQRAKDPEINKKIVAIHDAINQIAEEKRGSLHLLNNDQFAKLINEKLKERKITNKKGTPAPKRTSFITYAEGFAKYKKDNKEKVGNKDFRSINTTVEMIKDFKPRLLFEQIDLGFHDDFLEYLQDDLEASDNYIAKMFGNLKQILDKATDEGVNTKLDYLRFPKKKRRDVYNVYLSEDMLETLYNLKFELSDNPEADFLKYSGREKGIPYWTANQYRQSTELMIESYENVRKHLIIGCWTGMRGGNFLKIDPKTQINKNKATGMYQINAIANKGTGLVLIPVHWMIEEIYKSGAWPRKVSSKTFNEQVKEVCRLAGFDEFKSVEGYKGGKQVVEMKRFYEMVSTHTGRRSFCSNMLIAGEPKQFIMNISGHKTEATFNKYTAHINKEILTNKTAQSGIWKKPDPNPVKD